MAREFIQLSTDFACDLDEVFSFTKTAENYTRVVFKDPTKVDLVVYTAYDDFMKFIFELQMRAWYDNRNQTNQETRPRCGDPY